jgi:DNA modification methylase
MKTKRARHYMPNYTHEVVFLGSKGELAIGGPIHPDVNFQHDVWELGQFSAGGHHHPAAYPVALPTAGIVHMTASGEAVYDPFIGSGTTIIAAEQTGRRCYAMEIDPRYVAVAIKRWEDFTGQKAVRLDG